MHLHVFPHGANCGRSICSVPERIVSWPTPSPSLSAVSARNRIRSRSPMRLRSLRLSSLKLDVVTLQRAVVFQSGPRSQPARGLAFVPGNASEIRRRAVRDARIQPVHSRRAEKRDRRGLASVRQELVQRPADRYHQQFAWPARRRLCGDESASRSFRDISGPILQQPEIYLTAGGRCFRREGQPDQGGA